MKHIDYTSLSDPIVAQEFQLETRFDALETCDEIKNEWKNISETIILSLK